MRCWTRLSSTCSPEGRSEGVYLIIISCSARKLDTKKPTPAIDLYTGVFYGVLKKALKEYPGLRNRIEVAIVSAKYGLMTSDTPITTYDLKMTSQIAAKQRNANTKRLAEIVKKTKPQAIFSVMGKTYQDSIDFSMVGVPVKCMSGSLGYLLRDFKALLQRIAEKEVNL